VCYAFFDAARIQREATFLYDFHRLNVAVTRAKRKVIVLLSHAIRFPPMAALGTAAAKRGLSYINALHERSQSAVLRVDAAFIEQQLGIKQM
jgi:hypothetical protein